MISEALTKLRRGTNQNYIIGIVALCCPGMFNSLTGLGGAGASDPQVAQTANTALYATFAVIGFFGGFIFGILGNRVLILIGGLSYAFYTFAQYLVITTPSVVKVLPLVGGFLLGIGASLFWTAQGAMTMSYATESEKGAFISNFWFLFNLGGVLGGILVFGVNFNNRGKSVSVATYFVIISIMLVGTMIGVLLLQAPGTVIRSDGNAVKVPKARSPWKEFTATLSVFKTGRMLLLLPLFLASNWFYSYQFDAVNGRLFTPRTRGLNSALYWATQMLGSVLLGRFVLDFYTFRRKARAIIGLFFVALIVNLGWTFGLLLELSKKPPILIDFMMGGVYAKPLFVFVLFGLSDAVIQTYAYWIMGAIANDPSRLSQYAGYYKSIQSIGAASAWAIGNAKVPYLVQLLLCWCLIDIAIPFTLIVACSISEHSETTRPYDYVLVPNIPELKQRLGHKLDSLPPYKDQPVATPSET